MPNRTVDPSRDTKRVLPSHGRDHAVSRLSVCLEELGDTVVRQASPLTQHNDVYPDPFNVFVLFCFHFSSPCHQSVELLHRAFMRESGHAIRVFRSAAGKNDRSNASQLQRCVPNCPRLLIDQKPNTPSGLKTRDDSGSSHSICENMFGFANSYQGLDYKRGTCRNRIRYQITHNRSQLPCRKLWLRSRS
jgi:hypothetical protein